MHKDTATLSSRRTSQDVKLSPLWWRHLETITKSSQLGQRPPGKVNNIKQLVSK